MNTSNVRLCRNNESAITLVIILTIIRMVLSLFSRKQLVSGTWLTIQVVLSILLVAGCVVLYKFMQDSELVKYMISGAFIVVAAISIFNNHDAYNVITLCAIMIVTLTYLDESFSALCAGLCGGVLVIKTIIMFAKFGPEKGSTWLFAFFFFVVSAYVLYVTASNVVRIQKTDQQEIQYHLMYQEEVTQNMVDVVENGNQHIGAL